MKPLLLLSTLFPLLFAYPSFSQEYSYTHYNINDGLAGSTVYCMTQDKEGFIWAGTETGLSRFDGTHFKTFTHADGLPDVEILRMFCDSRNRVWMAPFRQSICYYYHGKFYNQENDPMLAQIRLKRNVYDIIEDRKGNVLLQEWGGLHVITKDGKVKKYDSIGGQLITECGVISTSKSGNFLVLEKASVYEYVDSGFRFVTKTENAQFWPSSEALNAHWVVRRDKESSMLVKSLDVPQRTKHFFLPMTLVNIDLHRGDNLYINSTDGCFELNLSNGSIRHYLPGTEITKVIRDDEGSLWFSTAGQGIFRLNSDEFKNFDLKVGNYDKCPVFSILKAGDHLFAGSSHSLLFRFRLPALDNIKNTRLTTSDHNRITYMERDDEKRIICGMDLGIGKVSTDLQRVHYIMAHIKNGCRKDSGILIAAGSPGCILFDTRNAYVTVIDTIFRQRVNAVYYRDDTTYLAALNGLYILVKDSTLIYLGEKIPFFRQRISAFAEGKDGTLWIAAYDNGGVASYKNGEISSIITHKQGLTSDICRCLFIHDNYLWIGTDQGLNKVDLGRADHPIIRYNSNDGLASDIINTVYADGNTIFVGTPAGLSYFDQSKTHLNAGCRLLLLGLINSGTNRIKDTNALNLDYRKNNMRFEFVGISYKSVGHISYNYRLLGLDSSWNSTKETFLDYPSLPSGDYVFQLQAINKFGVKSGPVSIRFTVDTPFWRSGWFYTLIVMVFLSLTWLFVSLRIQAIRMKQDEKDQMAKRIAEVEHMALQAQMNPHFIFNCLNSVQQYIFDQDIFAANKYISGLAKLIRMTLQNSSRAHICLEDEISYLSTYLSLEKLRFKEKMSFRIEVHASLQNNSANIYIPPMIIQPYVENSMRHGIRHKTDNSGTILVSIMPAGDHWEIVVEDNGIGREKAATYKTAEHIEYQSKGMSLTMERIRLINSVSDAAIRAEIVDLKDDAGNATGTRVVVQFYSYDINGENKII